MRQYFFSKRQKIKGFLAVLYEKRRELNICTECFKSIQQEILEHQEKDFVRRLRIKKITEKKKELELKI